MLFSTWNQISFFFSLSLNRSSSSFLPPPLHSPLLFSYTNLNHGFHIWFFLQGCCSVTKLCLSPCYPMNCSMPGFAVLHYLPEFTQTHVHCVGDAISTSHPLSPLLLLPSIFPSIRVFSSESILHIRWPKFGASASASVLPVYIFRVISFRMDWFDLLAVRGTLKSLLQHHSLKASILQCSAFFMVQFSLPYITPGKTIALTRWTFFKIDFIFRTFYVHSKIEQKVQRFSIRALLHMCITFPIINILYQSGYILS